eukprot:TRINITY_DN54669_c0_g1_i1.p1 TRINITY_DN54669_c0_g1~~TRINITY_DN54669_c0_g1_i1.p1  ORF type:complete len:314 (+),score=59.29 TRINITY_DN54669_c0_g1_i1:69-944(+)
MTEKEMLRQQWLAKFQKAQLHDSWGQLLEAQEEYQFLAGAIAGKQGNPGITSPEKDTMHRLALCLSARHQALQTLSEQITSQDMSTLIPVFEALFSGNEMPFPLDPRKYQGARAVKPTVEGEIMCGEAEEPNTDWHQARRVMNTVRGTVVSIRIEKIGLKDAQDYIDPYMTVIVADNAPKPNMVDTHDTPVSIERRATHVMFNHTVYLNISLEDMQKQGAALFFEFKHYKPKKKKVSTRCWAFMELSELRADDEMVLELYQKPTDLKKKSIKLHTEKQLYLHLFASFINSS